MRLTIEVTPEQGERLFAAAKREGIDLVDLARDSGQEVVEFLRSLEAQPPAPIAGREHFYFTASQAEFNRALDQIAEMNRSAPALPDEAFDRENLYDDRL
jgi:hypothetical protein